MQAGEYNFLKNGHKWTLGKQIEATTLENNYKLTPLLNRRSYNAHKGSDNFINLLDEESCSSERPSLEQNIKLSNAVLHSGVEFLHTNEKGCFCLPSKELFQRSAICFKASLPDAMSVDVASQSEFASQTLKPQNLELIALDDQSWDYPNGNANYKLKETSPGCLPSKKGKSKKLQRKSSYKTEQEFNADNESVNDNKRTDGDVKISDSSNKVRRKSSFISSVIKFAKFGRKKKRTSEGTQETSDDSNGGTESSEDKRENSSCQDEEFIFGGVRVFFDENGEFCEVDQDDYYDDQSASTFSSDNESECDDSTRCSTTKFESSDSLNLGYSGSFVT
jgi:hypothetical protein